MDRVMHAGGGVEDESADFFFFFLVGGRSSLPAELNLRLGCRTLLCLFSYQALASGSKPASTNHCLQTPQLTRSPSFSFLLSGNWLTLDFTHLHFTESHSLASILQHSLFLIFLTFAFILFPQLGFFFLQPSGSTQGCGTDPGPPGFHSDTLCPDVISIDSVPLDQAVLAHRAVYCLPQT